MNNYYIYPTDTVWGIGANIYNQNAHLEILKIKRIDSVRPMSILFNSLELLNEYLKLPSSINQNWLEKIFQWESTLLFPLSFFQKDIPKWIIADSSYVGIRYLNYNELKKIDQMPISTTSLNFTNESTIGQQDQAYDFYKKYCHKGNFIKLIDAKLSGEPSTIILFDQFSNIQIKREGKFINEIQQHCKLLST